jgi:rhodanese-related sulfurtransferase
MVRNVNREELKEMMEGGENFVLINALKPEEFEKEHICGSINMPVSNIASEAEKLLSKDNTLIVYCANSACTASSIAAEKLDSIGFSEVLRYEGGLEDWKAAGYCVEGMAYKGQAA